MILSRLRSSSTGILAAALLAAGCGAAPLHSAAAASADAATVPPPPTARSTSAATAQPASAAAAPGARIDAYIAQPRFAGARWGIDVIDLADGRTLYRHAADKLFVPASNAKLYTAALALHQLGPDARFTTTLYAGARPDARGVLHGDLILRGGGDPTLGTTDAGSTSDDWAARFAAALVAQGITRIRGDLIADATLFGGPPFGTGWEAEDLFADYAPAVSALSSDAGRIEVSVRRGAARCCTVSVAPAAAGVRVVNLTVDATPGDPASLGLYRPLGHDTLYVSGSLPPGVHRHDYALAAPDPARMAGQQLLQAITDAGIAFDGSLRVLRWPETDPALDSVHRVRIASVESPPLSRLVRHMLKQSDNVYAQTLLLQSGRAWQRAGDGSCGRVLHWTQEWGLCALRTLLGSIGITREQAHFSEGSGLSRQDLVTPRATTTLLAWITRQPWAAALTGALPVAGHDGTLDRRLQDLPEGDAVHAKTGTLAHMYTLSGYLLTGAGRRLAFSVMLNNYQRPIEPDGDWAPPSPTRDLDAVVRLITAPAAASSAGSAPTPAAGTMRGHRP
ncbi:MAG: D-alanyl-D-alanine carboxypeptidase/D-alanyl-D-alanine-endopeptidase [Xanthomonadaceae bacterium]|nr:D-alanyl-D-alanine carboxypeptidase/D-alanyl-D-alanine-endopeptidase [Xanthomonadaceae bacterium]